VIITEERNINFELFMGALGLIMMIECQMYPAWWWLILIMLATTLIVDILVLVWVFMDVVIGGLIPKLEPVSSICSIAIIVAVLALLVVFTPISIFFLGPGLWGVPFIITGLIVGVIALLRWCSQT